ncbi:MAG: SdpI family protein [Allosphingosinicella sp.]
MTRKNMGWLSLLAVLAMLATGAAVALSLPEGTQLPLHWNQYGVPDRMGSKWEALLMPGGVTAVIASIFFFLPSLEPRTKDLERSQGLYLMTWIGLLIVMATAQLAVTGAALGWGLPMLPLIQGSIGLLFLLIGNQLGKSRRMFLVGIRTPWTLSSEEVWIRTHRLAGKLLVVGGLLLMVTALLPLPPNVRPVLLIGVPVVALLFPALWSFVLWRRERSAADSPTIE